MAKPVIQGDTVLVPAETIRRVDEFETDRDLIMRVARVESDEVVLLDGSRYPLDECREVAV
jgi:hypothetical protein